MALPLLDFNETKRRYYQTKHGNAVVSPIISLHRLTNPSNWQVSQWLRHLFWGLAINSSKIVFVLSQPCFIILRLAVKSSPSNGRIPPLESRGTIPLYVAPEIHRSDTKPVCWCSLFEGLDCIAGHDVYIYICICIYCYIHIYTWVCPNMGYR